MPAAAIVCRTAALRAVGGFDEALRWGEDVDLVWRLVEAGWRCRYEPSVTVGHRARPTVPAWLRQQFEYGTSAAPLAARHPGALAPLRISGWSLAAWILAVGARRPLAGAALTVATAVALQRKLPGVPPAEVAELAGRGTLAAGEQIADAVTRAWWPVALLLLPVRAARLPVALALLASPVLGAWRCPRRARRGRRVPATGRGRGRPPVRAAPRSCGWRRTSPTAPACGVARSASAPSARSPRTCPTGRHAAGGCVDADAPAERRGSGVARPGGLAAAGAAITSWTSKARSANQPRNHRAVAIVRPPNAPVSIVVVVMRRSSSPRRPGAWRWRADRREIG